MPRYRVSFYTTGDNFEFTYEAANADDCLDRACLHASLMFGDSDALDEIVVRPDEGLEGREADAGFYAELQEPVVPMRREKPKRPHREARVPTRRTGTDRPVVATKAL